jgi:hypothetical protein
MQQYHALLRLNDVIQRPVQKQTGPIPVGVLNAGSARAPRAVPPSRNRRVRPSLHRLVTEARLRSTGEGACSQDEVNSSG